MTKDTEIGVRKKLKSLYLLKILMEETDEEHGLTTPQLIEKLEAYGIYAERKSIYSDIEDLQSLDYDIIQDGSGRSTNYKLVSREFELAELKLLVDSIQAAKFISDDKSTELIKKLEAFTSKYNAKKLNHQMYTFGGVKTDNEDVLINVDYINEAINTNKVINYKYWNWNAEKKKELKYNGRIYVVSPISLIWDNEYYYLVGYNHTDKEVRHYRVDKMKGIVITEQMRHEEARNFNEDMGAYANRLFGMYDGEIKRVELIAHNNKIGVLIDRLGKNIPIVKVDDEHFKTAVNVAVSSQFFGWIMGLQGTVKIIGPESVLEDMRTEVRRLSKDYLVE